MRSGKGLGHVMRLSALAQLASKSFSCVLVLSSDALEPERLEVEGYFDEVLLIPPDLPMLQEADWLCSTIPSRSILALDGYCFSIEYQEHFRSHGIPVVYIDDFASGHYCADLVLNHAPGAERLSFSHEAHTQLCLGASYRLVRRDFVPRGAAVKGGSSSLVICFGGTDPVNLIQKSLSAAERANFSEIHVVLASDRRQDNSYSFLNRRAIVHTALGAKELALLFQQSTAAVLSASTIALEAASVGLPFATGYFVDNQSIIYEGLTSAGAALPLGWLKECSEDNLTTQFKKLRGTQVQRRMVSTQRELFQEHRVHPLLSQLSTLASREVRL